VFSRRALAYLLRHRRLLAPDATITLLHVTISVGKGLFRLSVRAKITSQFLA